MKHQTEWRCYYLVTGDERKFEHVTKRTLKSWQHHQPQIGGKFTLITYYLEKKYVVIKNMIVAKYDSALLADEIGKV